MSEIGVQSKFRFVVFGAWFCPGSLDTTEPLGHEAALCLIDGGGIDGLSSPGANSIGGHPSNSPVAPTELKDMAEGYVVDQTLNLLSIHGPPGYRVIKCIFSSRQERLLGCSRVVSRSEGSQRMELKHRLERHMCLSPGFFQMAQSCKQLNAGHQLGVGKLEEEFSPVVVAS